MRPMNLSLAIVGVIAALGAAAAAFLSWRTAEKANDTAQRMEAIEGDRRHSELTPPVRRFLLHPRDVA